MNIEQLELGSPWAARLVENRRLTPEGAQDEVRELVLDAGTSAMATQAGQSIAVLVAGPHDFGQQHHIRLYTVAGTAAECGPGRFSLCVKRCSFIDAYSGERYPGIASNFLCDLPAGSTLQLAGPVGLPFRIPEDPGSSLLMIGLGTGAAPFRSLLREVCESRAWTGRILLFHGARSGLETVYRDAFDALGQRAPGYARVEVSSKRPAWQDQADLTSALRQHGQEVWSLLSEPSIHVYIAGLKPIAEQMDAAMAEAAGSSEAWNERKQHLAATGRWMSLLY